MTLSDLTRLRSGLLPAMLAVCVTAVGAPRVACAETTAATTAFACRSAAGGPGADAANALWDAGIASAAARRYEEARAAFTRAYAASAEPCLLLNLALAEYKAGFAIAALRHFRAYSEGRDSLPDTLEIVNRIYLPTLLARTARITVTAPPGARIMLDDWKEMTAGETTDVLPGEHYIRARSDDETREATVRVAGGDSALVALHLDPPAPFRARAAE